MRTWAQFLYLYYTTLQPPQHLPNGIEWLFPQQQPAVHAVLQSFLKKFYNDGSKRTLMLGINPGRFGAGITGVNFTAPKQLTDVCGISHHFKSGSEMSAEFIYEVIHAYGGATDFYKKYFIGSVCPLGFVQGGKNINYFDDAALLQAVQPFIINSISSLVNYKVNRHTCICIGGEKNYKYLSRWNNTYGWFENIVSLPHPRFIMQYKRKNKQQYIDQYVQLLTVT